MSFYETSGAVTGFLQGVSDIFSATSQSTYYLNEMADSRRRNQEEIRRAEERLQGMIDRQQQRINEQERNNARLHASVQALNSEINAQERRHNDALKKLRNEHAEHLRKQNEHIAQVSAQLHGQIIQARAEMQRQVSELRSDMNGQFSEIRAQRERDMNWTREQLQNVGSRIASIEQTIENHRELAEYWVAQAQRLSAEIREELRPEHFERTRWEKLQQTIENAGSDLRAEMFQTAAGKGRDAYQEACDLRDTLIAEETEWQETLAAVRQTESALLDNAAAAAGRTFTFELDGEQCEDEGGVDYWTYGQLSVLYDRIGKVRSSINENTDQLTTEQLQKIHQELTGLLGELSLLENAAAVNLAMAQSRYSMAERIGRVLGDEYLMVDADGDYFEAENRDEYHARFRNSTTGEEAVVLITPLMGEDGVVVNHAELIVNVPTNDPQRRADINQAVVKRVAEQVEGFSLPCSGQYAAHTNDEARRTGDISAVSEGKSQVRSQCSQKGLVSKKGVTLINPAVTAAKSENCQSEVQQG